MDFTFLLRLVSLQITFITAVQSARLSFYIHMYVCMCVYIYIYIALRHQCHILQQLILSYKINGFHIFIEACYLTNYINYCCTVSKIKLLYTYVYIYIYIYIALRDHCHILQQLTLLQFIVLRLC